MATKQPEPANAIATNSGTYSIQNWTRYRTEDILHIFNAVEEELFKYNKKTLERSGYRKTNTILYIDTYARAEDPKYRNFTPRQLVIKRYSSRSNELRIVAPEGLGLSETERLVGCISPSAATTGTPVPEEVLSWFIEEALLRYTGVYLASEASSFKPADCCSSEPLLQKILKIHKPKLRYLDRPESKKPTMESGVSRLERLAGDKSVQVYYTAHSFVRASDYMLRYASDLNKYAKKLGLPEYIPTAEITELHARIQALETHCTKIKNELKK